MLMILKESKNGLFFEIKGKEKTKTRKTFLKIFIQKKMRLKMQFNGLQLNIILKTEEKT